MGASAAASASACAALSGACARGCCVSTSSSQASTRAARLGLEGATPGATPAPAELLSAPKSEGEFPDLPWGTPVNADKVRDYLTNAMQERVPVLDGAMGTTIQQYKFTEQHFRGDKWPDWHIDLKGNNDLLVFTQPDTIRDIHRRYFLAGADIVETNTFSGTTIAQADYDMEDIVYELNKVASELAVEAAKEVTALEPHKPRLVAGAIGPTNRTLSISPSVEDPGARNCDWDGVVAAYKQQTLGLIDGGCHILMVETIFDTLNAKAALFAIDEVYDERPDLPKLPIIISGASASRRVEPPPLASANPPPPPPQARSSTSPAARSLARRPRPSTCRSSTPSRSSSASTARSARRGWCPSCRRCPRWPSASCSATRTRASRTRWAGTT